MSTEKSDSTTSVNRVVHTPGPWAARRLIDSDGKSYCTHYQAHIDIEPTVCMVWCPEGNAEQEANARLIAAAPDLLEAAVELLGYVRNKYLIHNDDKFECDHMNALAAAVEKARFGE